MPNSIKILEKDVVLNHKVEYFEMNVISLVLNEYVTIIVNCYDRFMSFLYSTTITIHGEEYLAWGSDDNYLMELICTKMGFTLASSVQPDPNP